MKVVLTIFSPIVPTCSPLGQCTDCDVRKGQARVVGMCEDSRGVEKMVEKCVVYGWSTHFFGKFD